MGVPEYALLPHLTVADNIASHEAARRIEGRAGRRAWPSCSI